MSNEDVADGLPLNEGVEGLVVNSNDPGGSAGGDHHGVGESPGENGLGRRTKVREAVVCSGHGSTFSRRVMEGVIGVAPSTGTSTGA